MNNEIKEILKRFEKVNVNSLCPFEMEASDCKKLLDYITNLQQENERLKERVAYLERSNNRREDTIIGLRFEVAEQEDYKSRCEKAIELLELKQLRYLNENDYRICTLDLQEVKDILQNGSDENEV